MKHSSFILIFPICFIFTFQTQNISPESSLNSAKPDCKDLIIADETIDGKIQVLKTKSQTLVSRGNYTYTIEFIHDQRGIVAKVYSYNGVKFNKGDDIVFMDKVLNRNVYSFIESGENSTDGGTSVHYNILKLDERVIDWFSTSPITVIYIKNNINSEMRKFTINENHREKFKQLATCFNLNLAKAN